MKKYVLFIFLAVFFFSEGFSQELVDIKNTGTCENALDISRFKRFGPTTPPQELGLKKDNSFQRPQHPAWYKFTVQQSGVLIFDIVPANPQDNYDFMLFKDVPDFCEKHKENKLTPVTQHLLE